jgi:hypothetical protein
MTNDRKRLRTLALCTVVCLAAWSASFAAGAEASPVWLFNGVPLEGEETTLNHAAKSSLAFAGLTTTCKPFTFLMKIWNSAGTGKESVTDVPISNCFTDSPVCGVETIGAEKLPWSAHLTTVSSNPYLIIEGVKLNVVYTGDECPLNETLVTVTGTAGGHIENETESVTFSAATFSATKTELKALGSKVEWTGTFTMIAIGSRIGQSVEVF